MILKLSLNTQIIWIIFDIFKNIDEYNPKKTLKILIVFDDMIADMLSNKNLNNKPMVSGT